MRLNNRIIFNNNAVLTDLTISLNDITGQTNVFDIIALEDSIIVGADLPFNNRYFSVSSANALASIISVEFWDTNKTFSAAGDVLDETAVAGATLARSGIVSFEVPKDKSWLKDDSENVTGITGLTIVDKYWAKFKFSANLTGTTALKFIGFKFSDDSSFGVLYPELNKQRIKDLFSSGKANWEEQLVAATDQVIRDLKDGISIYSANQIIRFTDWQTAVDHYNAVIIYNALGDDFRDDMEEAKKKYKDALRFDVFKIDRNRNTRLDEFESMPSLRVIRR